MKPFFQKLLSYLLIVVDLLIFGILPVWSVTEKGVATADDPIYLTAHRGVNAQAPENTLPAFRLAIEKGFYSAETDVHLTQDGVWVVSHNDNIKKWYNGNAVIEDSTFAHLRKYHVKSGPGYLMYGNLQIPTLEEYLDLFVGEQCRPQIEIKTRGSDYKGIDALVRMVAEKELTRQAIIISFDLGQLQYIRSLGSDIELWYLCDAITEKEIEEAKSVGGNTWLSCCWEDNTVESMQAAVDAGVPVSMWTVNSIKDAKMLYEAGFRYMETDRLCP